MEKLLTGQIALVTGGTAGIGKAISLKFAEHEAKVIIWGTNPERGAEVVQELNRLSPHQEHAFFRVDVSKGNEVNETIRQILEKNGKIDILVNNAGITRDNLLMKMSDQEWESVINTNLNSCFYTCQAVIRAMIRAKKGKIINIGSVVGLTGNPGQVNYAASKAGMEGFSKALAKEVGAKNICVNTIAPGYIKTRMTEALSEQRQGMLIDQIPLKRLGIPEDISSVALFLASSWSDYMTGQTLVVDGGMVM